MNMLLTLKPKPGVFLMLSMFQCIVQQMYMALISANGIYGNGI